MGIKSIKYRILNRFMTQHFMTFILSSPQKNFASKGLPKCAFLCDWSNEHVTLAF